MISKFNFLLRVALQSAHFTSFIWQVPYFRAARLLAGPFKMSLRFIFALFLLTNCGEKKEQAQNLDDLENKIEKELKQELKIQQNLADIDSQSLPIVNKIEEAMGGQQAWKAVETVSFDFFGARRVIWNKHHNIFKIIDLKNKAYELTVNMDSKKGSAIVNGAEILQVDSLKKQMDRAYGMAINDSYWLAMPFKLKDDGVVIKYNRLDTLENGNSADVLDLTFRNVGITPDNKYEIYVDKLDNLVKKWSFFVVSTDSVPRSSWAFDNYKKYEGVKLSANRSDNTGPTKLLVNDEGDKKVFVGLKY